MLAGELNDIGIALVWRDVRPGQSLNPPEGWPGSHLLKRQPEITRHD